MPLASLTVNGIFLAHVFSTSETYRLRELLRESLHIFVITVFYAVFRINRVPICKRDSIYFVYLPFGAPFAFV